MPERAGRDYHHFMSNSGADGAFERAVAETLKREGGYVADPDDPGGETKFGISKRSYPDLNIKRLSEDDAKEIYRRDFWERYGYGRIAEQMIAAKVFDLAVNMGPRTAHKVAQRALRAIEHTVIEDGVLGPKTLAALEAAAKANADALVAALRSEAGGQYRLLVAINAWKIKYLRGWLTRAYS